MAAKKRPARTTKTSRRPPRKRPGAAGQVRKRSTGTVTPDVVQAALAAFAHEVRTPLTGILAISDLLATSDLGERERRWADTIKAGAEHLASLATLFVDAARSGKGAGKGAGKGGSTLRQDLFDLRTLARSAGDSLAGRAAAKGLQAQVEISDKLPGLVVGDPVRLRAALENLIDNAVKFTDQGGVALAVAPTRGKEKGKDRVGIAFAVSDSGIGLTMGEIKRLFRPFTQANVTIASRFGGAGLGLSSVKQLARAMGGDITVAPRRGGGATFTLTVSLDATGPDKSSKARDEAGTDAAAALRVLSVEDNPFGRVVLNTILTELGHHAEFIGRGEDAVGRLAQGAFDAVLMDMVLPGIDGVEAIRRIRTMEAPLARIPIIGVSGRGEDEAASREAGADAFLVKPVSPRALATALLEATRREEAAT
ncbi:MULTISPECIES: ATP-binding protein [unclassified Bradyrhizobium]|uniref:ATP-binding protein n=1 Tax=unclassified Bradyrhizobium TaxID=2631580 RepID=UPI00211E93E5|nr:MULTISPECIES: ATP-binding protein [unclassified Bradyrhizobium]MDD1534224.1 hybrid sensor histidine kinase/response regulator [Bradyrhizobium sp. WBOS8]MDD1583945.1 hybrid sensor histidine kinase/response regulator [Bradyrhizobium sp. WBOS4]UUO46812.1 hybrid sensor histidine kinase/response regulator [Bradyrhizobium sp. WBOS04]UUO60432.1 hybrid sensor histidine kinase/response regulator [Bradyrhizobium sp. WBOS08]